MTAILAVTQSNQPVNPGGRWDLGAASPPQEESDDADGGGAPTIFLSGQSPIPLRAGIKYPNRESLTSMYSA
ncbi:MAG: hypothetical protein VXW26_14505, partial [SAR324 cluster bacterium]|nr:hypothetical protein [SAR324 cluster bacterium]